MFENIISEILGFLSNVDYKLLGLSSFFAVLPVAVWLYFLFRKGENNKKIIAIVFGIGCFTAPALLLMQVLWEKFPQFDLAAFIESSVTDQNWNYVAMFMLFGALEEIIKIIVLIQINKRTVLIKTLNDAIKFGAVSGLGFSFTENIYYLYEFWPSISTGELIQMYIFRSLFTMCAHMIFSAIFGYFYGVGKFSMDISRQQKITGAKNKMSMLIAGLFNLPASQGFQQYQVLKGAFIAIFTHAAFNFLLQFNKILPVIAFVVLTFAYLQYLLKTKAGHLVLSTNIADKKKSGFAKRDEEVVLELLGMWFKQKSYVDVIHTCERLLERDPDNNVIKLFKAKAMDKLDKKNIYRKILGNVIKTKDELTLKDRNAISRYTADKEMFAKVQQMIKKQLEKEGKKFIKPKVEKPDNKDDDIKDSSTFSIGGRQ